MKVLSHTAAAKDHRLLIRCLELYYRRGRSQKEIARELGISAPTISRLLTRAFDEGFVRVELDLPRLGTLEAELIQRYGLRDAIVVAGGVRGDVRRQLGAAAAALFERVAVNGARVGVSCGFTLYQTICQLRERRFRDLTLLPLSGEGTLKLVDLFPNTLVGIMAAKYRPHVTAYALPLHQVRAPRDIDRERRRLLRSPEVRRIYRAAQDVDIALVGIGWIGEQTPGFCALAESYGVSVKRLRALGVVGEINYQPFEASGRIVEREELRALTRRILSVSAERLRVLSKRADRRVIAVAGGRHKIAAIRAALAGRFVNVLVTDEDVAAALLRQR